MNNNKREEITNLIEQTIKDFMDYSKISKTSLARIIYAALSADGYLREVTKQQEPELTPYQRSALGRENSYKPNKVSCPYCNSKIDLNFIEYHVESCKPTNPTEPTTKETMEPTIKHNPVLSQMLDELDERLADMGYHKQPKQPEQSQLEVLEDFVKKRLKAVEINAAEAQENCDREGAFEHDGESCSFHEVLDKIQELKALGNGK